MHVRGGETKRFRFGLGMSAKIDKWNLDVLRCWLNNLDALIAVPLESGSPRFVPANNFCESPFQS
jgi:hypothetical protein